MKLNLTELTIGLEKLYKAQKENDYSNLISNTFTTLMRKNMNYSALRFCRSDQEAKTAYHVIMHNTAKNVKKYLAELKLQDIPISKQDELLGQVIIGEKQLKKIAKLRKTYPIFAFSARRRLKKQERRISEQEFDTEVWLSYLERQCKENNSEANILAELSKCSDAY